MAARPADGRLHDQRERPVPAVVHVPAAQAGVRHVRHRAGDSQRVVPGQRDPRHRALRRAGRPLQPHEDHRLGNSRLGGHHDLHRLGQRLLHAAAGTDGARAVGSLRQSDLAVAVGRLLPGEPALQGDGRLPDGTAHRVLPAAHRRAHGRGLGVAGDLLLLRAAGLRRGLAELAPARAGPGDTGAAPPTPRGRREHRHRIQVPDRPGGGRVQGNPASPLLHRQPGVLRGRQPVLRRHRRVDPRRF